MTSDGSGDGTSEVKVEIQTKIAKPFLYQAVSVFVVNRTALVFQGYPCIPSEFESKYGYYIIQFLPEVGTLLNLKLSKNLLELSGGPSSCRPATTEA